MAGALALASVVALGGGVAAAQEDGAIEVTGELTVVVGSVDSEVKSDADAVIRAKGSRILENGIEVGAAASLRADAQAPSDSFAGGRYSSILAGGDRGVGPDGGDVFLEGAYLFARGSFGSIHVGRDSGIASQLAVTSPTIFRAIGVNDWRTDLTGLNDVHTINDFSGQSTKFTYMPPSGLFGGVIGQVQLGLSYTPELSTCGDDGCAPEDGFAEGIDLSVLGADQRWQDVVETALYYSNGISVGEEPLRFGLSASYVRAEEDNDLPGAGLVVPLLGDYSSYALGLNVAYGNLTVGGSVKSTNAGLAEARDEDYLAFDAGLTFEAGEWNFMLGYGAADTDRDAALLIGPTVPNFGQVDRFDRETQTAQAGISYVFDHGVTLGAAAQFVDSEKAAVLGGPEEAAAVMFESSIKF